MSYLWIYSFRYYQAILFFSQKKIEYFMVIRMLYLVFTQIANSLLSGFEVNLSSVILMGYAYKIYLEYSQRSMIK